jgi:hypothetical protein
MNEPITDEDRRAAATMTVSLSTQLITAVLAILAAEGAYITFVLGNRIVNGIFYLLAVLTFLSFVLSIYFGGSGLHTSRVAVYSGRWNLQTGMGSFSRQTAAALVGIVFFLLLFICGLSLPPQDKAEDQTTTLSNRISNSATQVYNPPRSALVPNTDGVDDLARA